MTIVAKDQLACKKSIATTAMNCAKMFNEWREAFLAIKG